MKRQTCVMHMDLKRVAAAVHGKLFSVIFSTMRPNAVLTDAPRADKPRCREDDPAKEYSIDHFQAQQGAFGLSPCFSSHMKRGASSTRLRRKSRSVGNHRTRPPLQRCTHATRKRHGDVDDDVCQKAPQMEEDDGSIDRLTKHNGRKKCKVLGYPGTCNV